MMEVLLKDISKVSAGNSAPKKDEFSNEGTPFIRAGSLAFLINGKSLDKCEKVSDDIATKKKLKLFRKGSILFAKSGMSSKMGRIYQLEKDTYVVSHLAVIQVNDTIANPSYIKYFFILKPPFFLIRDDAYPSIKLEDIKNITLNLPDLPTQNKIVTLLDKASALVQQRAESIALLEELLRAQFLEMFGDPVLNPKGWEIDKFKNVSNGIESGWSPVCNDVPRQNKDEWAVLKQGAVSRRVFIPTENKQLPEGKEIKKEVVASKGDILFSRKNSAHFVGATVYVFDVYNKLLLPDTIFKLLLKLDIVRPLYIYQLFNDGNFKLEIQNLKNGAASSMPNISKVKLNNLELPIPPIELQNQFETIYHNIQAQKESLTQSKTELEHLYNSLLQRAFSGQLNFNVDIELDALLASIDLELDTEKEKHDIKEIATVYAGRLLERIEEQKFENQTQYQQAKQVVFQMLEEGIVEQAYDKNKKAVRLKLV